MTCRLAVTATGGDCLNRARGGSRTGVTVVELAITLPIVLSIIIGMVDLGIAVYAYNAVAEAARAGTRYAAVHGSKSSTPLGPASNNPSVDQIVRNYLPGMIIGNLQIQSEWPDASNDPGRRMSVTVTYNYTPAITWMVGFRTLKLSSKSTIFIAH